MDIVHRDPPIRVETYRTSEGKEFTIRRRPRRGRKYQKPQLTGDRLVCPYCFQEHDVVSYKVAKGRKAEKKVRTWICPKVGKLPLNQGRQWDDYIGSIIVRDETEAEPSSRLEVQTSEGASSAEAQLTSTLKIPGMTHADFDQPGIPLGKSPVPKPQVIRSSQATVPIAEFPVATLARRVRTGKVRRDSVDSCSVALRRFIDRSPKSLDRYASGIIEAGRLSRRGSVQHATLSEKLYKFRTR